MRIILSPTKQMKYDDTLDAWDSPMYLSEAQKIQQAVREKSLKEMRDVWNCSEKIARDSYAMTLRDMTGDVTPALFAYHGIAFKYMNPDAYDDAMLAYVQEHLRIISGMYGVLRPMDGVINYRLEMQTKLSVSDTSDLYEYWGTKIYDGVMDESHTVVNLASKEYGTCIESYLTESDRMITCVFGETVKGKIVQKGVYAKMARGSMVTYMAEHQIEDPEEMKAFHELGFVYQEELSNDKEYIFIKCEEKTEK